MRNARKKHNLTDAVKAYLAHKAGALKRPNGKYLDRMETRLSNRVFRRLNAQRVWVVDKMHELSFFKDSTKGFARIETKTMYDEIDNLMDDMPFDDEMVQEIIGVARPTYKKGAQTSYNELALGDFGISFDIVNDRAVRYLQDLEDLQLSDFRGSIRRQTREKIRNILRESAETGRSYTETSKLINEQGDAGVFSRARGELIAVNQVGHAYGQGNYDMVDAYRSKSGAIVQKFWQTVEDDRVTPECAENEDMGWIGFDEAFASSDERAPRESNPRCRCTTTFRSVDTQGNPI